MTIGCKKPFVRRRVGNDGGGGAYNQINATGFVRIQNWPRTRHFSEGKTGIHTALLVNVDETTIEFLR